jgi:SAM-dependent methyltransferase
VKSTVCRFCKGSNLKQFLDLGSHPPSDAFLNRDQLKGPEPRYPLDVDLCVDCGGVQLGYVVPPDLLYCKNYPYESSTTRTGRAHFFEMAKTLSTRFKLKPESLAIDLGSNVGVLLSGFRAQGVRVLGVDPARIMAEVANTSGIETINDFFTGRLAREITKKYGRASAITATNVFAHIDNLDDIMSGIGDLLTDTGVFVIEAPHFLELVNHVEYDTIYHEHLSYISLKPLVSFFKKFDLELFDVERIKIHGGSLRIYTGRRGCYPVSPNVEAVLALERQGEIHSPERLGRFAAEVQEQRRLLVELLRDLKGQGKRIVGVSAPAKGNTLLNYCGITNAQLDYITEKAQMKVGYFTPGTHIPIYGDDKLLQDQPDYALILAWNFSEEIMANLREFKERGGKFIIPIPKPRVI